MINSYIGLTTFYFYSTAYVFQASPMDKRFSQKQFWFNFNFIENMTGLGFTGFTSVSVMEYP